MSSPSPDNRPDFQQRLGYTFRDRSLLDRALTHKSFSNENREAQSPNNERLEFLGDALLNLFVAELVYEKHPRATEEEMTRLRRSSI